MIGGLPVWFRVSDRQIAFLRRYCIRILIICFAGLLLSDSFKSNEIHLSVVLTVMSIPISLFAVSVSLVVPTVRLRLFWTLPPVAIGWLALLHVYTTWAGIQFGDGHLVILFAFLIGGIAIYTLTLMTMAEAGQGRGLQVMSPDWKTVKD